jgi:phage/plasmid-like protein (TIGR03299 family)
MTSTAIAPQPVEDPVFGLVLPDTPVPDTRVRRTAWQGVSTAVAGEGETLTSHELLVRGGLDWDVEVQPTWRTRKDGTTIQADGFATVRLDEDMQVGTVRSRYEPFQNREVFAFGDKITEGRWVSTGQQKNGAKVFMVMQLNEDFKVLGEDGHTMFLVFRTSHDGSTALRADVVPIRMGCWNQNQIINREAQATWKVRHVKSLEDQEVEARKALTVASAYQERYQEIAEQLAATEITIKSAQTLIKSVMDNRAKRDDIAAEIEANWRTSGTIPDSQRMTGWGLLNGVTEYFDHMIRRQGNGNSLFDSVMEGEGARTRNRLAAKLLRR